MKLAVQFRRSRKLILSRLLALLRPNSEDLVKDLTGYGVDRAGSSDLQKGLSGSVAPTDSHGDADTPSERGKEAESSAELQAAADRFNTWMLDQRYPTNKLLVSVFDGMRLGTYSTGQALCLSTKRITRLLMLSQELGRLNR